MSRVIRALTAGSRTAGHVGCGKRSLIGAIACCVATPIALAAPSTSPTMPTIVLESNVGECSPSMHQTITPLLDALAGYGFVVKPATIASLLGPRAPRPGILDKSKTAREIAQQIEAGLEAFRTGRFEDAEVELKAAIRLIKRNPGVWVLDGANAALTFTAVVRLAVAQKMNNHPDEAYETMMDLLRMSSVPVTKSKFGPRAEDLYTGAQKQVQRLGRGSLVINVSDPTAVIFVEGQFRGIGKVAIGDLIPGPRHPFVQVGSQGRQYEISVASDRESTLDIDWEIDSSLLVDEACAGFAFANPRELANEGVYARQLARLWGAKKVIVVGLTRLEGNLALVGTMYPADGSAPWQAKAPLSEGEDGVRSLARFLVDGTRSNHLNVIGGPSAHPASASASASAAAAATTTGELSLPSKIVLGTGGVAVAAGITAYLLTEPGDPATDNDRRALAVYTVMAGSPVLGAGLYLGLRDLTSASHRTSALLGGGAACLLAGSFLYLTDEDPGSARRYYRDSATVGVVVGVAGIGLAGAGAWLWRREHAHLLGSTAATTASRPSAPASVLAPAVAVGPSSISLRWSGRF